MSDETVFVEVLTDEELSVLARPGGVAVSPYLDAMAPPEQHVARRTAYRSLLARGIVDPPSAEALDGAALRGGRGWDGLDRCALGRPARRPVRVLDGAVRPPGAGGAGRPVDLAGVGDAPLAGPGGARLA